MTLPSVLIEWNYFTTASILMLAAAGAFALFAAQSERPVRRVWLRVISAGVVSAGAFGVLGDGLLHGDVDQLLSIDRSRLTFAAFDSSSVHYACLSILITSIVVSALRGSSFLAAGMVGATVGGLLLPIAAKIVWFGPLRRFGMIDIAGATVICTLAGSMAVTLARLTADRALAGVVHGSNAVRALAGFLLVLGWCAAVFSMNVMQSPATPVEGVMNVLRSATAAGLVSAVIAKLLRQDEGPLRVLVAIQLGIACTTALAGRAPGAAAVFVGLLAGTFGVRLVWMLRRAHGTGHAGDGAMALWLGGLVACLLATPYSRNPEAIQVQLIAQLAGWVLCSGVGICSAMVLAPFIKLFDHRRAIAVQPIAAS